MPGKNSDEEVDDAAAANMAVMSCPTVDGNDIENGIEEEEKEDEAGMLDDSNSENNNGNDKDCDVSDVP